MSTTSNFRSWDNRRSVANLSMAQKQIAPTTTMTSTPIRTEISPMCHTSPVGCLASAVETFASRRRLVGFNDAGPFCGMTHCGEIAKADLFFVSTDRKESEVDLDPYSVKRLRLERA